MKKNIFTYLMLCMVFIGLHPLHAEPDTAGPNRLFGGVEWLHSTFKSKDYSIDQNIWSGMVGYKYSEPSNFYLLAQGMWGGGSGDETVNSIDLKAYSHLWFLEARLGYQLAMGQNTEFRITPYFGYYYNAEKFALANTLFLKGYNTKVRKQSIPVGIMIDWSIVPQFEIGIDVEAFINVWGQSVTNSNNLDSENKQNLKKNVDWSFQLPLTYHLNSTWDLALVPFYDWKKYEPKDFTIETKVENYGARLEVGYNF